jgi:hypothetical protein
MQVYVGLDLGIDTEDDETLAVATYDDERSRPNANENEVLHFRLNSDKH